MAVRKIKIGNNQALDIHDARISGVDTSPVSGSENVITSGAVYTAINNISSGGKVSCGTTSYWQSNLSYIPIQGEIVVYTDHSSYVENDETVYVPGVKIGDGSAYGIDLPFIDDAIARTILAHTTNTDIHVTSSEKASWNNKLCLHENPVVQNNLYFFND